MKQEEAPNLSESLEDYLEAIYHLVEKHRVARANQVAKRVGVSKSSVTAALNVLAREGLVNYEPYQFITLTDEGEELARKIARRHAVIKGFLRDVLGAEEDEAERAACRLEHGIRGRLFERFVRFVEFLGQCPRVDLEWKELRQGGLPPDEARLEACLAKLTDRLQQLRGEDG